MRDCRERDHTAKRFSSLLAAGQDAIAASEIIPPSGLVHCWPQGMRDCRERDHTAKRFSCVLGMLSSLEVKVFCPT